MILARRFHAASHRADVGVATTTDVLHVEDEHVYPAQHVGRRFARRSVKRMRNQSGHTIASRFHVTAGLFCAIEAVLRRVQRDQIAVLMQQNSRARAVGIDARLVCD